MKKQDCIPVVTEARLHEPSGVGRFYAGEGRWAYKNKKPLWVYAPDTNGDAHAHVGELPSTHIPLSEMGYENNAVPYPMKGHRKEIERILKKHTPNCVGIATPGPVGLVARDVALAQKRLLVGTYHTDFPAFIRQIIRKNFEKVFHDFFGQETTVIPSGIMEWMNENLSPDEMADAWTIMQIAMRNRDRIGGIVEDKCGDIGSDITTQYMRWFYAPFDRVIARSNVYKGILSRDIGIDASRIRVLNAGVDTSLFQPTPREADDGLRERLGFSDDDWVALYVGRISPEKNTDFLADVWREFLASLKEEDAMHAHLAIVGSGDTEALRERAGRTNVHLLGGRHGEELTAIYRMANIFISASEHETLGQVVLEALACGTPVVVANKGAAHEHVCRGLSGIVLSTSDPSSWVQTLRQLQQDRDRCHAMGSVASHSVKTIEESYEHFLQLHQECLEEKSQTAPTPSLHVCAAAPIVPEETPSSLFAPFSVLSDLHLGKREKKSPKELALDQFYKRAQKRGAVVWDAGDRGDDRETHEKNIRAARMDAALRKKYGVHLKGIVRGNHDFDAIETGLMQELVDCPVHESLVAYDDETGILITHGHVTEIPDIDSIIRTARSRTELLTALSPDALDLSLKMSAVSYDAVHLLEYIVRQHGLTGVESLWERMHHHRQEATALLRVMATQAGILDPRFLALLELIGTRNRVQTLALLGAKFGAWGVVSGHTHEPSLEKVTVSIEDESRTLLVGNSGSFVSDEHNITWAEGGWVDDSFPVMRIMQYNRKKDGDVFQENALTPKEAMPYRKMR